MQQWDQQARSCQGDPTGGGVLVQGGLLFQGEAVELVAAEEQHHELGAAGVEGPVLLGGELVDVGADVSDEAPQVRGAFLLVLCLAGLQHGRQGHLRIHEHRSAPVEVDAHVGAQPVALR